MRILKVRDNRISRESKGEAIVALLVFLFSYTGIDKYWNNGQFRNALLNSILLKQLAQPISLILPGVEIILVIILTIPGTRLFGLKVTIVLLAIFTIYIIYMIMNAPHLPCSCGGIISKLSWKQHIFLNIIFIAFAYVAIKLKKN